MFSLSLPVQTTPIARPSLSMIGEPDIPPTVLAPMIHSGPPKLCTRLPSQVERQEKRRGILPGLRNAKRRHCPRERFILLILVVQLTPCTHKLGGVTHRS